MDDAIDDINALKTRLKKFEKNFKKCSQANRTKGYLEGRLKGLEEIWNSICESDATMNSLKDATNENIDYFENDEFDVLEEKKFQLVGQINEYLNEFNPQPRVNSNVNPNMNHNQNQQQNNQSKVKLPKISLPSFSGSYHNWLSFKNRFTNLIHDSTSLSKVEKLEYLKSCLNDEAERTIQRYQITDQNYDLAWKQLDDKYDNQRILQVTQAEMIIDRKIIKIESAKELRELIDVTQECLESLKNLNVDVSTWDIMLIVLITRKLPLRTRELWEEELKPADVPTYQQLCEFLEKRYRTLESLELIGKSDSEKGGKYQFQNQTRNSYTQPSNHRINCLSCNLTSHSLLVCEKFLNMSLSNRSAFVNAKGICRNCLAMSHTLSECKSNKTCFKCGRKHHTLLHRDESGPNYSNRNQFQSQPTQYPNYHGQSQTYVTNQSTRNDQPVQTRQFNNQRSQVTQNEQQTEENQSYSSLNPNADLYPSMNQSRSYVTITQENNTTQSQQFPELRNYQSTQNIQSNHNGNQERVLETTIANKPITSVINPMYNRMSECEYLFPTASINVKSANGKIMNLRALLDQCSGKTYIKESVASMLGLQQVEIPAFVVEGLDEVKVSTVTKTTNFEMFIRTNESMNVKANIVANLVGVLPKSIVRWPSNIFTNIQLADSNFATPGDVDIMLGGEIYNQLLLDGVLKERGYLAQNTKLGWIISGKSNESGQPQKNSFCGFTQIARKSYENWSNVIEMKYPRMQRSQGSYQKSNQSRLYYPIFRSSHHSTSDTPLSDRFNKPNRINANQSNNRVVIGSSDKQKSNLEEKRADFKSGDQKAMISKELLSVKQVDSHNHFVPYRPSLIDFNINRLCESNQISRIVKNFAQRWKSE